SPSIYTRSLHDALPIMSHTIFDLPTHLPDRFVGEGQRHDTEGIYTFIADQVRYPVGQDPRLARPRAGNEHAGAVGVKHTFALRLVQKLQEISHNVAQISKKQESKK